MGVDVDREACPEGCETDPLIKDKHSPLDICGWRFVWLENLRNAFGPKLLILLFVAQHLVKGFCVSLSSQAAPYLYRDYSVVASEIQIYGGITSLPWALKPIIGLVSDVVPIAGYNKGPYMLISTAVGMAGFAAVGMLPVAMLPVVLLVCCIFATQMQASTVDLLSEAKYAERMQATPQHGPALLSYVWFGLSAGSFVAVLVSGPTLAYLGPKWAFLLCTPVAAAVMIVVAWGYVEEQPRSAEEVAKVRQRFANQAEACTLCGIILLASVALTVVGLTLADPFASAVTAAFCCAIVLVSFSVVLSPVIAKFNAFSLIQTSLTWSVSGAAYYFYTDTAEQYPEGPHFSAFFYNSVMGTFSAVLSMVGIITYQRYLSDWSYRTLLLMTNTGFSFLCLLDVVLFTRTNLAWGIPDTWFVLGTSGFQVVIQSWQWMPQVVIMSYFCPKGMEATMYALLAGCHNLGNTIAANCGAYMLDRLGVKPSGALHESAQFENLWKASAVSTLLPLITILLLFRLIPDARQSERLLDESHLDATTGSLWQQWTKSRRVESP